MDKDMRNALIDQYIDRLLAGSTAEKPLWNMERILSGAPPHWNYIDSCMITALWSLYEQGGDSRFCKFASDFMDYYIPESGLPLGYHAGEYNLDNINGGRVLFDIYNATNDEKYFRAIRILRNQIGNQPRTNSGGFWHKLIYPNQIWLDGLYMAQVFAVRWALTYGDQTDFDDVCRQFSSVREHMFIPEKGLYRHGYDESRSVFWADPASGLSGGFWLRAIGWFLAGLVDVLGYWYDSSLAKQFSEAASGLLPYMDVQTGMFWQVVDEGDRPGNYLETSGSAMAAYAFLKGARLGVLSSEYQSHGRRVFGGICENRLSEGENGLNLGGICLVAGLGPAGNTRRNGSFEYYISEPIVENDAKGVAPLLMCYSEILRL